MGSNNIVSREKRNPSSTVLNDVFILVSVFGFMFGVVVFMFSAMQDMTGQGNEPSSQIAPKEEGRAFDLDE